MSGIFMHRFFVSIPLEKEIILPVWDLYHQLTHVFRARVGESCILFSEWTDDMTYEIISISKKSLSLSFQKRTPNIFSEVKWNLVVFQSYPNKLSTLELLVQKFTELWVEKVVFWRSEHAQMQDISEAKQSRIESIAREALEQCGANRQLQIEYTLASARELLEARQEYIHIIGHYEWQGLPEMLPDVSKALWIGPEGGWSASELSFFSEKEMILWKFNNRILRLETAAIIGAGILLS